MNKYVTTAAVTFRAGMVLGLSKTQADLRAAALTDLGKGLYRVAGTVQFKAGEEIAVEGEVDKRLLQLLSEPEAPAKKGKAGTRKAARGGEGEGASTQTDGTQTDGTDGDGGASGAAEGGE